MIDAILVGVTFGFAMLVMIQEIGIKGVCRVCTSFWMAFVYCAATFRWWDLGLVILVCNASFIAFQKVAYDVKKLQVPEQGPTPTGGRT